MMQLIPHDQLWVVPEQGDGTVENLTESFHVAF